MSTFARIVVSAIALAAIAAPAAPAGDNAFSRCGTVRGGGTTWSVVATGNPCGAARTLVQTLAVRPHPSAATRLGTHLGLQCTELARGGTREIACVSRDGRRSVYGVSPAHK